jgi:dTDP-4-dehydrorhamnose 3,5-epimerase
MKTLKIKNTDVEGCHLIDIELFEDQRGVLGEIYNRDTFKAHGLPAEFLQDNLTLSHPRVIRGLHFQKVDQTKQGKLIRCLSGVVRDVCVDLRPQSPTFKKYVTVDLKYGSSCLYIPEGCAHGFSVLGTTPALILYKMTDIYDPTIQLGVHCQDSDLDIDWGVQNPIISEKDLRLPSLKEYLRSLS